MKGFHEARWDAAAPLLCVPALLLHVPWHLPGQIHPC
jgi:hypothetical protein